MNQEKNNLEIELNKLQKLLSEYIFKDITEEKEGFHVAGPRARRVQLTFHVTENTKFLLAELKKHLLKHNVQMSPDFGIFLSEIGLISLLLFPVIKSICNDNKSTLRIISRYFYINVCNTLSSRGLIEDLNKLQSLKDNLRTEVFNYNADLIKKEISPMFHVQIEKLIKGINGKCFEK